MPKTKSPNYNTLKPSHRERLLLEKEYNLGFNHGNISGNRKGLSEGTKQGKSKATGGLIDKLKTFPFGQRLRFAFFKEAFINELQQ